MPLLALWTRNYDTFDLDGPAETSTENYSPNCILV